MEERGHICEDGLGELNDQFEEYPLECAQGLSELVAVDGTGTVPIKV